MTNRHCIHSVSFRREQQPFLSSRPAVIQEVGLFLSTPGGKISVYALQCAFHLQKKTWLFCFSCFFPHGLCSPVWKPLCRVFFSIVGVFLCFLSSRVLCMVYHAQGENPQVLVELPAKPRGKNTSSWGGGDTFLKTLGAFQLFRTKMKGVYTILARGFKGCRDSCWSGSREVQFFENGLNQEHVGEFLTHVETGLCSYKFGGIQMHANAEKALSGIIREIGQEGKIKRKKRGQ